MERVHSLLEKAKKELEKYPTFQKLEDSTGAPKEYLALGGVAVLVIFLFAGVGAGLICNLVGFIYPAYMSFKAIESTDSADDTQWLTYWVVYAFFSVLEVFTDALLYWVPFYFSLKLAFLFWCFLPSTRGAFFIYDNFLRGLLKSGDKIDDAIRGAKKAGAEFGGEAKATLDKMGKAS